MKSKPVTKATGSSVERLLPEQFAFLLTDRPTLPFESSELYDRLLAALMAQYDPKNVMDCMLVKDIADCHWEILRLRRMKNAALAVELQGAARKLLGPTFRTHAEELKLDPDDDTLDNVTRWWAQGYPPERDAFLELQEYAAVTDDMLLYEAFATKLGTQSALDACLGRAERRRDQLTRMLEDRARTAASKTSLLPRAGVAL